MRPHEEIWTELREVEEGVCAMLGRTPSVPPLRDKLSALHRRLARDPPAGKDETVRRLMVIRDDCVGELARFRPAVERALQFTERRT
jgi:hypothetical protein